MLKRDAPRYRYRSIFRISRCFLPPSPVHIHPRIFTHTRNNDPTTREELMSFPLTPQEFGPRCPALPRMCNLVSPGMVTRRAVREGLFINPLGLSLSHVLGRCVCAVPLSTFRELRVTFTDISTYPSPNSDQHNQRRLGRKYVVTNEDFPVFLPGSQTRRILEGKSTSRYGSV